MVVIIIFGVKSIQEALLKIHGVEMQAKSLCDCETLTKAFINKNTCQTCKGIYCPRHLFTYVDGNNRAITKNSPQLCEVCYNKKYKQRYAENLIKE